MKSDFEEFAIHESIRPRNETSEKKKMIAFIKKQKDKREELYGYKKKKKLVGYSEGQWTLRELKLYHRYLSTHRNEFTDAQLRKRNKVFIKLADFIGSRTPDQCRSHHQKATSKFPDFDKLLSNYETRIFHLSKLYEDMNQASIQEREREEEMKIRQDEQILESGENEEKKEEMLEEEQIMAKIEEKEEKIHFYNLQEQIDGHKADKPTGEVFSKDFYKCWMGGTNKLCIEIQQWALQQFH